MKIDLARLKAERVAKGLTQEEMARLMGWKSRAPYSKREAGLVNIGANELLKFADILNIKNVDIFFTKSVPKRELKEGN